MFASSCCCRRCPLKTHLSHANITISSAFCGNCQWNKRANYVSTWIILIYESHKSSNLKPWRRLMEHLLLSRAFYSLVMCPQSHGSLGDQLKECGRCPLSSSALLLPRCKMWWFLSPGTTCWRWDWAELLLFAPLAPGFHGSLFLTLQEWCDVIYRCKVTKKLL